VNDSLHYTVVDKPAYRATWPEHVRAYGVGSSDQLNHETWLLKTGKKPRPELPPIRNGRVNYRAFGVYLERAISNLLEIATEVHTTDTGDLYRSVSEPHMVARVDGWLDPAVLEHRLALGLREDDEPRGLIECKNTTQRRNLYASKYETQCQHLMQVTGTNWVILCGLITGNTLDWHVVRRDERAIKARVEEARRFWQHVEENVPFFK
jgi:hypothetical protein